MILVRDASVAVKWFFPDSAAEQDADKAVALLQQIGAGLVEPLQPVHWLSEVIAVINRLDPDRVDDAIDLLDAMEFAKLSGAEIYKRAGAIAARHNNTYSIHSTMRWPCKETPRWLPPILSISRKRSASAIS
jgi:predicted nucleic acid-binding protein